jgi:hypothetical protein
LDPPLNSTVAQPMSGTEGATYPFWSADSRYVAFFGGGKLNKVDASGGPPQALCDAPMDAEEPGAAPAPSCSRRIPPQAWRASMPLGGRVSPDHAGHQRDFPSLARFSSRRQPLSLLRARHYAQTAASIWPRSIPKERKLLLRNDSNAIYAAPGYLLLVRDNTLMAQRFNLRTLALEGEAKPVADHVAVNTDTWRSILTASATVSLSTSTARLAAALNWSGTTHPASRGSRCCPKPPIIYEPALSPDASKLAFVLETNGVADIWVVDLARHTKTRITFGPLYSSLSLSGGPTENRLSSAMGQVPVRGNSLPSKRRWHRQQGEAAGYPGIIAIPFPFPRMAGTSPTCGAIGNRILAGISGRCPCSPTSESGEQKPFPVVATNFQDVTPSFSPDGQWLAYANDETGRMEVYIQPFPSGAGRWQVSTAGGSRPNWRKDGKELFFIND